MYTWSSKYFSEGFPQKQPSIDVLKICSKSAGEHPCRSVISTKLLCSFIEIVLRHGCSPVNLLHFFSTRFYIKTYGGLLLFLHVFLLYSFSKFGIYVCFLYYLHHGFVFFHYKNMCGPWKTIRCFGKMFCLFSRKALVREKCYNLNKTSFQ